MSKYGQIVKTDAELKPCPFCGGKCYIIMVQSRFYATCDTCTCRVAGPLERENTAAEAIAVWNKRDYHHGGEATKAGEYVYGYDGNTGHWLTGEKIVRCHDCVHFDTTEPQGCTLFDFTAPKHANGFCLWGEKVVGE